MLTAAHRPAATASAIEASASTSRSVTPQDCRAGAGSRAGVFAGTACQARSQATTPWCCTTPSPLRQPAASPASARARSCS